MNRFQQRIKVKVCFFIALHINKQKKKKRIIAKAVYFQCKF